MQCQLSKPKMNIYIMTLKENSYVFVFCFMPSFLIGDCSFVILYYALKFIANLCL